jgi:2,3-bisphosphoglycerate-dependent phosphoglycerate mutase
MQFYFIRHGQSENNALWDRGGPTGERSSDPELTELGHKQAECLALFLAQNGTPRNLGEESNGKDDAATRTDALNVNGIKLTHLYCSPMIRCIETGTYLSRALDLPLTLWEHPHEVGGIFLASPETGVEEGLPGNDRCYLQSRYPDLILPQEWGVGGWWNRPFEQREQRILRAQRFHRELVRRHGATEDRVAVVSHAGFFNYWIRVVLDWTHWDGKGFWVNNASLSRVDLDARTSVMYVNRTDYLPRELIS